MALSPDWHFALPPAGGDRERRPPQTLNPVPTGLGQSQIPLVHWESPCHFKGHSGTAPYLFELGKLRQTQSSSLAPLRKRQVAAEKHRESFSDHSGGGASKDGRPSGLCPAPGLPPGTKTVVSQNARHTFFESEHFQQRRGGVRKSEQQQQQQNLKKKKKNTVGASKHAGWEGRGPEATGALCLCRGCRPEQEVAADTEEGPF